MAPLYLESISNIHIWPSYRTLVFHCTFLLSPDLNRLFRGTRNWSERKPLCFAYVECLPSVLLYTMPSSYPSPTHWAVSAFLGMETMGKLGVAGIETRGETACKPGVSCCFPIGFLGMEIWFFAQWHYLIAFWQFIPYTTFVVWRLTSFWFLFISWISASMVIALIPQLSVWHQFNIWPLFFNISLCCPCTHMFVRFRVFKSY